MKRLNNILPNDTTTEIVGQTDINISGLALDSRNVERGNIFFAIKGTLVDGHQFIEKAIQKRAIAIVCEKIPENTLKDNVTFIKVKDSAEAMGKIAAKFYGNPSGKLKLVGITGTNGKTTTATLLYRLINTLGGKAGLISTIQNQIGETAIASTHTTPNVIEINSLLSEMVNQGCTHCFMEVSSHATDQKRVAGLVFSGAIFTNITHDHLDYHKTFKEYIEAKKLLFDNLSQNAFALTNVDDRNGRVMVQNTKAKISTYSIKSMASYRCKIVEQHAHGMLLNIDNIELWSRLIGNFNAYNLLAVYATALLLNFDQQEILTAISGMGPVNGRFENFVAPNGVIAVVDYAHTPDALENVLSTLNSILNKGNRLITVVGAGGNRDKTKRPIMAQVALQGSHMVILTADNPRHENPAEIIEDMKKGVEPSQVGQVLTITDRREAIRTACLLASPNDVVLIAGKGHETYQEVKGVRHHFDDKEEVSEIFKSLQA
ncbi:MAG: UDP-N-acetylmuramoyl-L-alanyl-D-glutamate--2,6-diaminopimelate ligase [Bacteroidales bacterium]|nr:UDP-N-acetylmuramoyl-L-alanyl-D-glutamate--2,6-diaminopimelate ligase [Bacteroidales bacterium]MDY0348621.1 UDP-N-acetylmuramoyl-L-alanyl-D-glutamate--2,6-diaminopimelate ligase [Tenuifilaceae bacterium]